MYGTARFSAEQKYGESLGLRPAIRETPQRAGHPSLAVALALRDGSNQIRHCPPALDGVMWWLQHLGYAVARKGSGLSRRRLVKCLVVPSPRQVAAARPRLRPSTEYGLSCEPASQPASRRCEEGFVCVRSVHLYVDGMCSGSAHLVMPEARAPGPL